MTYGGSTSVGWNGALFQADPSFTMPLDCFYDCEIYAQEVSLYYWPPQEVRGNTSQANSTNAYTLTSDGFEFVSPSVYIAYTDLEAIMTCQYTVSRIGRTYNTLIAYPQDIISTMSCNPSLQASNGGALDTEFKAINYTALEEQTTFCSGRDYPGDNPDVWSTRSIPFFLSFPPGLQSVDPKWKTCSAFLYGGLDPPRTLTKATALVDPAHRVSTADPGAKPTPANAPATPTPDPPAAAPAKNDPPAQNDPPAAANPPPEANSPAAADSPSTANPPMAVNPSSGSNPPVEGFPPAGPDPSAAAQPPPGADSPTKANPPNDPAVPGTSPPDITVNSGPQVTAGSKDPGTDGNRVGAAPQSAGNGPAQDPDSTDASGKDPAGNGPNVIIMGVPDNTQALPSVGGTAAHVLPTAGVEVAGSTIPPGQQTNIAGTSISVGIGHAVIGGSTYAAEPQQVPTPVLVGGQHIVASNGGIMIGGSSYVAGAQTTISGTSVSVGTDNLVVGGSTFALPSWPTATPVMIDGNAVTRASNGDVVFQGSTIALQTQAVVAGHTLSVGASSVVVDGSSYLLPVPTAAGTAQDPTPGVITLADGAVISAGGSAATMSGTTYSIPSDGNEIVVNGKTTALPSPIQSVFTIGGQTFTAAPSGFTIGGQSVTLDGAAITVSGTVVSLGPSGLQIGSSTIPLTPAQQTQDSGLGGLIMSGFGNGGNGAANSSTPVGFTGAGLRLRDEGLTASLALLGISIGVAAYAM